METILDNVLNMPVSTFMKEDMLTVMKLSDILCRELVATDVHKYDMEDFINWSGKVSSWCENLSELVDALTYMRVIIAKKRLNTPENEDHIDGVERQLNTPESVDHVHGVEEEEEEKGEETS